MVTCEKKAKGMKEDGSGLKLIVLVGLGNYMFIYTLFGQLIWPRYFNIFLFYFYLLFNNYIFYIFIFS